MPLAATSPEPAFPAQDSAAFCTILYGVDDAVACITMNRPPVRNGLNRTMALELAAAVGMAERDPAVGSLLLTGAGSAFCSGADLGTVNTDDAPDRRAAQAESARSFVADAINPLMRTLYHCAKPVVAAVNGPAVGGGIGLALAADIVIAARSARFMATFTPLLALIPDLGSTWMLPRLVGPARAAAISLLGETVSAEQAEQWGMIWRCCADDQLAGVAQATAAKLATGPSFASAAAKHALHMSAGNSFDAQLDVEMTLASQCCGHPDFCEAASAFLGKRAPQFARHASALADRTKDAG